MNRSAFNKKGFTLIELLIVIGVVGILAILVITAITGNLGKGNDARRKGDLNRISVAAEEYEKDHNCYPTSISCGENPAQQIYPYLRTIPCDPATHVSYAYEPEPGNSCPSWYRIYANLQNTADPSLVPNIGPSFAYNYYVSSPNAPAPLQGQAPTIAPSSGGTFPSPSPSSSPVPGNNYYGCINGICTAISWDPSRPGPVCDPNYRSSTCYGECGPALNECKPWK